MAYQIIQGMEKYDRKMFSEYPYDKAMIVHRISKNFIKVESF